MNRLRQVRLRKVLKPGKTLVYFASGSELKADYQKLEFENVILIDNSFKHKLKNRLVERHGKVICLALDSLEAVFLFKQMELKIDCFVAINEGLYEGGGHYALNSDSFLGYVFPILADTVIHIGYRDYYGGTNYYHLREHWLDIPYNEKQILKDGDDGYISPAYFTDDRRYASNAEVTLLSHKSTKQHIFQLGNKEIAVSHSSIWNDSDTLDAAFVRFENHTQKDIIFGIESLKQRRNSNLFPLFVYGYNDSQTYYTTYNFEAMLALCESNRWKHIGMVPNQGNYDLLLDKIRKSSSEYPEKVSFYHLNRDDFSELYNY